MRKKILGGFVVAAIAAMAAFNINFNMNEGNDLSAISLANVEALAQSENWACRNGCYDNGGVAIVINGILHTKKHTEGNRFLN